MKQFSLVVLYGTICTGCLGLFWLLLGVIVEFSFKHPMFVSFVGTVALILSTGFVAYMTIEEWKIER